MSLIIINHIHRVLQTSSEERDQKIDFLVIPLFHPRYRRDSIDLHLGFQSNSSACDPPSISWARAGALRDRYICHIISIIINNCAIEKGRELGAIASLNVLNGYLILWGRYLSG